MKLNPEAKDVENVYMCNALILVRVGKGSADKGFMLRRFRANMRAQKEIQSIRPRCPADF
jgi:hypothetical protein